MAKSSKAEKSLFSNPFPYWRWAALGLIVAALLPLSHPAHAQPAASCPVTPPAPNLIAPAATQIPSDVCIPAAPLPGVPFVYFDDLSWRSFIALVWPAASGQRGVPDLGKKLGEPAPSLVFETYKADWETFQRNAAEPTPWDDLTAKFIPCANSADVKPGDLVLASFNEFGNVGEAGIGTFVHVLVAQNQTYARYLAAYNKAQFQQIRDKKLYLVANVQSPGNTRPINPSDNGAITIKSSWIDMTNVALKERFYTRSVWLQNPKTLVCSKGTVGLVGLHIVQKTPSRPQWIWSTFEHIDNVPGPNSPAGKAFTFNKGDGKSMPQFKNLGKEYKVSTKPEVPPPAFNVQRLTPIATSTADTNTTWQQALKAQGSVWQFYQLVMTQWPVPPDAPQNEGTPQFSTPPSGSMTAWANSTMETFDQTDETRSCMACHNRTRTNDFIWGLSMRAGSPPSAGLPKAAGKAPPSPRSKALEQLRETAGKRMVKE